METKTFNDIIKKADALLLDHLKAGNYSVEGVEEYTMTLKVGTLSIRFWCSQQGANYYSVYDDNFRFPLSKETKMILATIYDKEFYDVFNIEQEIKRLEKKRRMLIYKLNEKDCICDTTEGSK